MFKKMVSKLSVFVALVTVFALSTPTTAYADEAIVEANYSQTWCDNNKNAANYSTYCNNNGTPKAPNKTNGATNGLGVTMNGGNLSINGTGFGSSQESAWNTLYDKYETVIMGISGVGTLAMVMFFIWNAVLLGKASSDPGARQKAVTGLIWSGAAAMILGSATLFVGVFYGMLK